MMSATTNDIFINSRESLERLCDASGRLGIMQLPLFRAAADGLLVVVRAEDPSTPWPARGIERYAHRPHASCSAPIQASNIPTRHHRPNGSVPSV